MFPGLSVVSLALALALASPAMADTVSIGVFQDATIYQDTVNNANGTGMGLFAGVTGNGSPRRALLSFDIAGNVPAGSTITSVELTTALGRTPPGGPTTSTIGLNLVTSSWGEGPAGAGTMDIAGTGQGFPAAAGDVTWTARAYPGTLWTTPGSDHVATPSATVVVGNVLNVVSTWGSTSLMVSDVQGWLNTPSTNYGWLLKNLDEVTTQNVRVMYSKEWSDPALRPQLLVTYLAPVPVPAAVWLFGSGIVGLAGMARRNARAASSGLRSHS